MWFELLIFILGVAFGYFQKGNQDLWDLLKTGLIIGVVLAVIFGLIGFFLAPGGISLAFGLAGGLAIFISVIIFVILFIIGVFIGDYIEKAMEKKPA
ncbi:MAG: hypothetical protein LUQ64_01400 [Methanomicrobiales archaeon]|nr:hypothetical protein [Methanomicrobiales archaeon]